MVDRVFEICVIHKVEFRIFFVFHKIIRIRPTEVNREVRIITFRL